MAKKKKKRMPTNVKSWRIELGVCKLTKLEKCFALYNVQ
jgi:hypothetical protein